MREANDDGGRNWRRRQRRVWDSGRKTKRQYTGQRGDKGSSADAKTAQPEFRCLSSGQSKPRRGTFGYGLWGPRGLRLRRHGARESKQRGLTAKRSSGGENGSSGKLRCCYFKIGSCHLPEPLSLIRFFRSRSSRTAAVVVAAMEHHWRLMFYNTAVPLLLEAAQPGRAVRHYILAACPSGSSRKSKLLAGVMTVFERRFPFPSYPAWSHTAFFLPLIFRRPSWAAVLAAVVRILWWSLLLFSLHFNLTHPLLVVCPSFSASKLAGSIQDFSLHQCSWCFSSGVGPGYNAGGSDSWLRIASCTAPQSLPCFFLALLRLPAILCPS